MDNRGPGWQLLALALLLGGAGVGAAAEDAETTAPATKPVCPICSKAGDTTGPYSAKAGTTFVRGAANSLFGWTELLRRPVDEAKGGGNVVVGVAKGIGHGLTRTLTGLGEVLTFWLPKAKLATDCPICMGQTR